MFSFFKKKEAPKKEVNPKDTYAFLADFHEKQGDKNMAFYFRHKVEIDLYESQITQFRVLASQAKDDSVRLENYQRAKSLYDSFKEWCLAQQGGEEYFDYHDHTGPERISQHQRLIDAISEIEYKMSIPNTILKKAEHGILQSELVKSFDGHQYDVRLAVQTLEEEGKILREKKGRSYFIKTI